MPTSESLAGSARQTKATLAQWQACRARSLQLALPLSDADATAQSMDDASPTKWHLAHTTWFFEEFVLSRFVEGYRRFDAAYAFLFNSYYDAVGPRHARSKRGLLTRPSLDEVYRYRAHVDEALAAALAGEMLCEQALELVTLGQHHEEQHQELLLTDILHLFSENPLRPAYVRQPRVSGALPIDTSLSWVNFPGGIKSVGHKGRGFAFDSETPAHDVLIRPFQLASRLVTNRDWLAFIDAKGYDEPGFWLSDGFARAQALRWRAPLYWEQRDGVWWQMSLAGMLPLELDAPVSHVSFFEADAFARFSQARLPTEFEWECAAADLPVVGNVLDFQRLRPMPAAKQAASTPSQMFGDVWEWTASPFMAYPRFRASEGAVGEYNGKFMNGQFVLRGGSCATPPGHVSATYRNFFYPHQRWQFAGVRLAKDLP